MQKSNIKVLLIGPYPPPIGGQSILIETIIKNGPKYGIDYILFDIAHSESSAIQRIIISNRFVFQLLILLLIKGHTFNIVHIHTSAGLPLFEKCFLGLICRLFCKPVILHIHGGKLQHMLIHQSRIKHVLVKNTLRVPSLIIVLSDKMQELIKHEVSDNLSTQVLENATRISISNSKHVISQTKKGEITLLFVGHLKIEKGLLDLLEAFKKLQKQTQQKIKLTIVGGVDNSTKESDIQSIYNDSGVKGIQFTGVLTGYELNNAYEQADIFVLPSHSEDQPLTLIEAMGYGLPVISTNVGSIPDLIENGVNGFLVNTRDVDSLLENLKVLVNSEDTRRKIGEANRKLAVERFGFDNYMIKLKSIYEKMAV